MPRHLGSGHDSLNISFSTGSNQSEDDPPKHPGYVTSLPGDLADHSTWYPTMSEAVSPSLSNVSYHSEVDETHATDYPKIKAAEDMVTLLLSKLGDGEAGGWEDVWSQSSTIACVACPATYEHQKRRHRTHTVHTATLNGWHPLEALGGHCHYFGLEPHHLHHSSQQELSDVQQTQFDQQPTSLSHLAKDALVWNGR